MDYKNGMIYKLVNDELNLTYYGSTCTELRKRLCSHKSKSNKCSSKIMFETGVVKIYLVEEFPTENKMLLNQRERWYIENNECINKGIPSRTVKEYYLDNKDKIKEYYLDNKDKKKEYQKEYRIKNKDKLLEQDKKYKKEFYLLNKKRILEYQKEYYLKKKLEI